MQVEEVKVWDIFVRIFHWSLVISFAIAYITEDDFMWLHEVTGYIVLALVIARIFWGLVGSRFARFSNFIYKPATIKKYLFDSLKFKEKRYLGHNPLGGVMVVVLFVMLLLTSWSGIEAHNTADSGYSLFNIEIIKSALASDDDDEHGFEEHEFWEEVHEFLANATLVLIFLHIVGVIVVSVTHKENLVRSMVTGRKRKEE
jgi:cytochrome b